MMPDTALAEDEATFEKALRAVCNAARLDAIEGGMTLRQRALDLYELAQQIGQNRR